MCKRGAATKRTVRCASSRCHGEACGLAIWATSRGRWLGQLVKQGVYFLLGYKEPVTLWDANSKGVEVLDLLPLDGQQVVDVPVTLGTRKQVQSRLISMHLPYVAVTPHGHELKMHSHT